MNTIAIKDILNGYRVDSANIQSVANMTVLPIISDTEFTDVSDMHNIRLKRDIAYNQLEFENSGGKIGISIQGWSIIDSQQAQDRTVPHTHIIRAGGTKVVPANCIQSHQCGNYNVSQWNQENFMVLPSSLRGIAIKKNPNYRQSEFSSMWNSMKKWASGMDCESNGLQIFYSTYKETLDNFVAEFEPVDKQLGAIVFLNGELTAIDLVPKYDTWKQLWRPLIRDSYGAEAIRLKEAGHAVEKRPSMDISKVETLEDLVSVAHETRDSFVDDLKSSFGAIADYSLNHSTLDSADELTLLKMDSEDFVAEGVIHGDRHFVYLSLVKSSARPTPISKFKSLRNNPYQDNGFRFN